MTIDDGRSSREANRIILALDTSNPDKALDIIDELGPFGCGFKLGMEAAAASIVGPRNIIRECVDRIRQRGGFIFIDQKPHDIKNTDIESLRIWLELEPDLINLHAAIGVEAMKEVAQLDRGKTKVIAVTVLTDKNYRDLAQLDLIQTWSPMVRSLQHGEEVERYEKRLLQRTVQTIAEAVANCGLDGIICSAEDLPALQAGDSESESWQKIARLLKVTPGIRFAGGSADDQKRIATPRVAIANGADYLVVGRPILKTETGTRVEALWRCIEEIEQGLQDRGRAAAAQEGDTR